MWRSTSLSEFEFAQITTKHAVAKPFFFDKPEPDVGIFDSNCAARAQRSDDVPWFDCTPFEPRKGDQHRYDGARNRMYPRHPIV